MSLKNNIIYPINKKVLKHIKKELAADNKQLLKLFNDDLWFENASEISIDMILDLIVNSDQENVNYRYNYFYFRTFEVECRSAIRDWNKIAGVK